MKMTGSNLSLPNIEVDFKCDGDKNVTTTFHIKKTFTRQEAAALGKSIAETGVWEDSPISVSTAALKAFGNRLREYGEKGV